MGKKKRVTEENAVDPAELPSVPALAVETASLEDVLIVIGLADPNDRKVIEAIQSAMQAVATARPDLEWVHARYSHQSGSILMTWERSLGNGDIAIGKYMNAQTTGDLNI